MPQKTKNMLQKTWWLPYIDQLSKRTSTYIDLIVIHSTELPDLAMARDYGERILYPETKTGASGHFYIDRNGDLFCFVPPERIAHHVKGYNERSIGIELVNAGRYPNWFDSTAQTVTEAYPCAQIACLKALLSALCLDYPSLRFIAGHSDLDLEKVAASDNPNLRVRRKIDPGVLFPWPEVLTHLSLKRLYA
jgi:N-acetylmuramoyl-L-alanine amidase